MLALYGVFAKSAHEFIGKYLMQNYNSVFIVERIELMARLGFYDAERAQRQPISISFRLYHPKPPVCLTDDHASFVDYQRLVEEITAYIESQQFRMIEFLTHQLYQIIRRFLDDAKEVDIKIWIEVCKMKPDVAHLNGGARFIFSDLPPQATIITI
jgi:dihydroneopterin aldolase